MEILLNCAGIALIILAGALAIRLISKAMASMPRIRIPRIRKSRLSLPWSWSSYSKTVYQSKTGEGKVKVKVSITNGIVDYKDSSGRKFKGPMDDAPDHVQKAIKSIKKSNKKVEDDFNGMFDDLNDMFKDDDFFKDDDD